MAPGFVARGESARKDAIWEARRLIPRQAGAGAGRARRRVMPNGDDRETHLRSASSYRTTPTSRSGATLATN